MKISCSVLLILMLSNVYGQHVEVGSEDFPAELRVLWGDIIFAEGDSKLTGGLGGLEFLSTTRDQTGIMLDADDSNSAPAFFIENDGLGGDRLLNLQFESGDSYLLAERLGINKFNPSTKLDLKGAITIEGVQSGNTPVAGTIQIINGKFQGYDGTAWVDFGNATPEKEILGRSNTTSTGRFIFNNKTGMEAANEMCKATFPNIPTARMYFPDDIQEALRDGSLATTATSGPNSVHNVQTWTVAHAFNGFNEFNSMFNNCYCLLFNNGPMTGTVVRIYLNSDPGISGSTTGNYMNVNGNQGCGLNLPVICGK